VWGVWGTQACLQCNPFREEQKIVRWWCILTISRRQHQRQ
jgi:hypothetical protein